MPSDAADLDTFRRMVIALDHCQTCQVLWMLLKLEVRAHTFAGRYPTLKEASEHAL